MRPVGINPVLNGWTVRIGCQTVVFTDADKLCSELARYIDNPEEVEKDYLSNAKNREAGRPELAEQSRDAEQTMPNIVCEQD